MEEDPLLEPSPKDQNEVEGRDGELSIHRSLGNEGPTKAVEGTTGDGENQNDVSGIEKSKEFITASEKGIKDVSVVESIKISNGKRSESSSEASPPMIEKQIKGPTDGTIHLVISSAVLNEEKDVNVMQSSDLKAPPDLVSGPVNEVPALILETENAQPCVDLNHSNVEDMTGHATSTVEDPKPFHFIDAQGAPLNIQKPAVIPDVIPSTATTLGPQPYPVIGKQLIYTDPTLGVGDANKYPVYFGIKSYLHEFYGSPDKDALSSGDYIQEIDEPMTPEPQSFCSFRKVCLFVGFALFFGGVVALVVGRWMGEGVDLNHGLLKQTVLEVSLREGGLGCLHSGALLVLLGLLLYAYSDRPPPHYWSSQSPCPGGYITVDSVQPPRILGPPPEYR